jgi:hypothetical protein
LAICMGKSQSTFTDSWRQIGHVPDSVICSSLILNKKLGRAEARPMMVS